MMGLVNPWHPMRDPVALKHLGKLSEELGEAQAAVARCIIQGIGEAEPVTGKPNRQWLQEELADVLTNIELVVRHFDLASDEMLDRVIRKSTDLRKWHEMA